MIELTMVENIRIPEGNVIQVVCGTDILWSKNSIIESNNAEELDEI